MKSASFAFVLSLALTSVANAQAPSTAEGQKPIKTLINAIRYSKDDLATKQVGYDVMVEKLMDTSWKDASDADKKELISGMEKLIRGISFPAGRDIFKYLDNVLYDAPRLDKDQVKVKSTVVIHRDLKKSEIVIDWVIAKSGGQWKVYDTVMQGESTLAGIRDEQIKPLLKEGGVAAVKKAMNEKVAEISKK
ncbi:MAG: ABC transporter substrate-binding protein [Myxococcota bacterium]